jgi:hypothetical protein
VEIGRIQGVYEELFLLTVNRKIENPIAKSLSLSFVHID